MRSLIFAAAMLTASSAPALAEQPTTAPLYQSANRVFVCDRSPDHGEGWLRECATLSAASRIAMSEQPVVRQVFICDSADTQRSWAREFGPIKFVSAAQLAEATASNEAWDAPRCMTSTEARRYAKRQPDAASLTRAMAALD